MSTWDEMATGKGCPFCGPESESDPWKIRVDGLAVSTLYLKRDQRFAGHSYLIFRLRHVNGLEALTREEGAALMHDLQRGGRALQAVFKPDQMNYATLGNAVPHLHWQIIPRYKDDGVWGRAIWRRPEDDPPRFLPEQDYVSLIARLRESL